MTVFASIEDQTTGEDVPEITAMVWTPHDPKGVFNRHIKNVERDPKTGRFQMHVPAMEISVFAAGREYSQGVQHLTPVHGQEVTIRVTCRIPVLIELRDGEHVVPWPIDDHPRPRRTEGTRRWIPSEVKAGRPRLEIPTAGTYRFDIPEVSGYRKHPPVEVDVAPGPLQTIVVDLRPNESPAPIGAYAPPLTGRVASR